MVFLRVEIGAEQQIVRHPGQARDPAVAGVESSLDGGRSSGTTLLMRPKSRASAAEIFGLRNQISFAFFLPTISSRYQVP